MFCLACASAVLMRRPGDSSAGCSRPMVPVCRHTTPAVSSEAALLNGITSAIIISGQLQSAGGVTVGGLQTVIHCSICAHAPAHQLIAHAHSECLTALLAGVHAVRPALTPPTACRAGKPSTERLLHCCSSRSACSTSCKPILSSRDRRLGCSQA